MENNQTNTQAPEEDGVISKTSAADVGIMGIDCLLGNYPSESTGGLNA